MVNTDGIERLDHVQVELRFLDVEHVKSEVSETEKVVEARTEELSELKRSFEHQEEICDEAHGRLMASLNEGSVSLGDIIGYLSAIYDEKNGDQIAAITRQLDTYEALDQSVLQSLARNSLEIPRLTYEDRLKEHTHIKL